MPIPDVNNHDSLIERLEAFDRFINGSTTKSLSDKLAVYDKDIPQLQQDFHDHKIKDIPEAYEYLTKILKSLNVSAEEQTQINGELTVYEFLATLAQKGHPQLIHIVNELDNKKRFRYLRLILGPGILVSLVATIFSLAAFHLLLEFLRLVTSSLIAFPIIGLICNTGLNICYILINFTDSKKAVPHRVRDFIFILISAAIQISAYSFLIATGVATSPIAGALFVSGAVFNVFKELFCFFQEVIIYHSQPKLNENTPLAVHKSHARREFEYQKRLRTLGINFMCALAVVGISVFWSFVPGGIPIAITALTLMTIVFVIKIACIKYTEYRLRENLQTELTRLEVAYNKKHDEGTELTNMATVDPSIQSGSAATPFVVPNQESTPRRRRANTSDGQIVIRDIYRSGSSSSLLTFSSDQRIGFDDEDASLGYSSTEDRVLS